MQQLQNAAYVKLFSDIILPFNCDYEFIHHLL